MIKKFCIFTAASLLICLGLASCGSDDNNEPTPPETDNPTPPSGGDDDIVFAKGADVSWVTELEDKGNKFYSPQGKEMECMQLLRDHCGVNAIRLRVWVNPSDKYNSIEDVMVKARRAHKLGLRLMIDFHLSDNWADPGKQIVPEAWKSFTPAQMADAVAAHVTEMLRALKSEDITPEWVQIGNETTPGMLHPLGEMRDSNPGEFPRFLNAGYDAVKKIFPDAQVIVHLDAGNKKGTYRWFFDLLNKHNGRYDMIGMSLYPENETYDPSWSVSTDESAINDCIDNMIELSRRYGKKIMLCEIGFHHSRPEECRRAISKIISSMADYDILRGIFYWEPESEPENTGYHKGCFKNGRPTVALDPFIEK